ncbi:MAG: N-acetylmuramoyl-L-alanine amidase [Alphaproteobacteria bacterium]|nr:N-acetylmuramoyl-L-alanine amidase [Alphaproteobacteria bacterium]MCB9984299.1 N-acetylmuramoyl-L-alanine amidase [Micavibrio sp.]HRK97143.1 N-acetylmuramoyl-L-alanine amidase [Alphaproteobacteria bacterium]
MVIDMPSKNWDERAGNCNPTYVIIHYTGTKTADEAKNRFCDKAPADQIGRIAPHYMIDGNGDILRFVDESKRAWHAGHSKWKNIEDMNSASIGVEIWNSGHEHQLEEFLVEQIESVISLIEEIKGRWNIPDANILGHSDIAPGRKLDPGEKFPWRKLEVNGIGLMPELLTEQGGQAQELLETPDKFYTRLSEFGYTYTQNQDVLLKEFRRHYLPQSLDIQELDIESCQAILSLLRQSA